MDTKLDDSSVTVPVDQQTDEARKGTDDPKYEFVAKNKYLPYRCTECDRYYATLSSINAHMLVHRDGGRVFCDICNKDMRSPQALIAHLLHHSEERPYPCTICNIRCKTRGSLKEHYKLHKNLTFKCSICGKDFNNIGNCRMHEAKHTKKELKEFKCNLCEKVFHQRCLLAYHMRTHTGERPEVCEVCGSAFADKSNLRKHYRIHTGERPFKCKVCDKGFNQKSSLTCHMRSHNTYKPFGCKHCGKMFGLNEELIVHLRVHGERLMFKCNACDLEFTEHSYLKSHQRLHTQYERTTKKPWVYKEDVDLEDQNNFLRDGEEPVIGEPKKKMPRKSHKKLTDSEPNKLKAKIRKPIAKTVKSKVKKVKRKRKVSISTDEDSIGIWHDGKDDASSGLNDSEKDQLPSRHAEHIPTVPLQETESNKPAKIEDASKTELTPIHTAIVVTPKTEPKLEILEDTAPVSTPIESVYVKVELSDESDFDQPLPQRTDWKKLVADRFSKQKTTIETSALGVNTAKSVFNSLLAANHLIGVNISPVVVLQRLNLDTKTVVVSTFLNESLKLKQDSNENDEGFIQYDNPWVNDIGVEVKLEEIKEEEIRPTRNRVMFHYREYSDDERANKLEQSKRDDSSKKFKKSRSTKTKNQPSKERAKVSNETPPKEDAEKLTKKQLLPPDQSDLNDESIKKETERRIRKIKPDRKRIYKQKEFQCQKCPKRFTRKLTLDTHSMHHLTDFRCSTCSVDTLNVSGLRLHLRENQPCRKKRGLTDRIFECEYCDMKFYLQKHLTVHMFLHTNTLPFQCDICKKYLRDKFKVRTHMFIHTGLTPYKCDQCDRGFTTGGHLKQHMLCHTDAKPFKCEICLKGYKSHGRLYNHKKIHLDDPYKCVHCGKGFKVLGNLQNHELRHTAIADMEKWPCTICPKVFNYKHKLKYHMRTHTGERPYQCSDCNSRFADISNLQKHRRIHTGAMPYKCAVCDRKFNQLSSLNSHKKSHITYKPFECVHCSKCFALEEDLTLHLRRLHGENRNFKCNLCDREYEQLNHFKSHRRLHLGREVSKDERNVMVDQYGHEIQYKGGPKADVVPNPPDLSATNDVNIGRICADGQSRAREIFEKFAETAARTTEVHNYQPQQLAIGHNFWLNYHQGG